MVRILFALLTIAGGGDMQSNSPADHNSFVGTWILNIAHSKLPGNYPYTSMTLQVAVVFDSVTIGGHLVTQSGQAQTATELFHMDGKEHPGTLNPGVVLTGTWINARVMKTGGKKDGQDVGVVTYEVSPDGRTLTQTFSGSPEQAMVFDRR